MPSWPAGSRPRSSEPPEPLASAVLLERHGAVAVGRDPDHAVNRLELVEVLCRTWRDAFLIRAARASLAIVDTPSTPGSDRRDHERTEYLAELLGTFMFMMVGYMSFGLPSASPHGNDRPPGRAVRVRFRPAGRDLRVRPHLRGPFQPGRHGRDRPRRPPSGSRGRRLHHRPDHRRDRRGSRPHADVSQRP